MNEIINIYQLLQHLPLLHLGIGVMFILLIRTKNNFSQPSNIPYNSHASIFAVFTFLFAVIPLVYFGWGFYHAYFPDYKYDEILAQVNFHVYRPNYLPNQVQQGTQFTITGQSLFPESPTVHSVYATALDIVEKDQENKLIFLMQSKAPTNFSLLPYIENRDESSAPLTDTPTTISITSFPGTSSYVVHQELITQLYLLTNDNVLIVLTSPKDSTSVEELVKMAESLH